jgi:hypothetical protein
MPARLRDYVAEYQTRLALHPGRTARQATGHHRRPFAELTELGQSRAISQGRRFGLNRRQAKEQYDRGTFRPFARRPAERVPQSVRRHPERAPLHVQRTLAFARAEEVLGGVDYTDSRGRHRVVDAAAMRAHIFAIGDADLLLAMIRADRELWLSSARFQYPGNPWWYHHA